GVVEPARQLVAQMQHTLEEMHHRAAGLAQHPRIYFEEWPDPLISGIGWVGELIALAGGEDIFADVQGPSARERVVAPEEVARRQPDVIFASWCGKKVDRASIRARPGWAEIPAVRTGRVYEIPSA